MKKLNRQVGLAFALAAALWVPVGLGAAAPQNIPGLTQTGTNQFTVNTNQTNTVQLLEQFMALRDQLQTNQDEELRQLVAQMNSAPAEQKAAAEGRPIPDPLVDGALAPLPTVDGCPIFFEDDDEEERPGAYGGRHRTDAAEPDTA